MIKLLTNHGIAQDYLLPTIQTLLTHSSELNSMTHYSPEINCIDPLLRVSAQGMQSDEN
jgi:hypothetical protein